MQENPIVFISYSWDSEAHKEWVLQLANTMRSDGIDVILDRYHLQPGANISTFVEASIRKCNRILIILSEQYKQRAQDRVGGVGQEFALINTELIQNIGNNERVIPLLKSGNATDSIPDFLKQYIYVDFRNDEQFSSNYEALIREIYKEPEIKIPELGKKPNFGQKTTTNTAPPIVQNTANQHTDQSHLKDTIRTLIGEAKVEEALKQLTTAIEAKSDQDLSNRFILIQNQWKSFSSDRLMGLLRSDEINITNNKINLSILRLVDDL